MYRTYAEKHIKKYVLGGRQLISDKGLSATAEYNFEVLSTQKGRGSLVCSTSIGFVEIKEVINAGKIDFQNKVLKKIEENKECLVDVILENKNGELITLNKEETPYMVKRYYMGREIDVKDQEEILLAVRSLALIHSQMYVDSENIEEYSKNLTDEFERHNKELKKIRAFIRKKTQKTDYELEMLKIYQLFLDEGLRASERLKCSNYCNLQEKMLKKGEICHGDYNQHNVIILSSDREKKRAVINFDKCYYGVQMADLYNFMRKILEKNQWNVELGREMIKAYNQVKKIEKDELENLYIRFLYPYKFWKVANYYYNTSKSWTAIKNVEKLRMITIQNSMKNTFLKEVFKEFV